METEVVEPWLKFSPGEERVQKKFIENRKNMINVIESWWSEKQEYWARGFLSWNRENPQLYGTFPEQFQARAKEKGINLIIDRDFDLGLLDHHHPDRFSHMVHVSFVLFSLDYVESSKCVHELVSMEKLGLSPCPIMFYTDDEIERKPVTYYRFHQFLDQANKSNGTKDDITIHTILGDYFYGKNEGVYEDPPSADLPLATAIQMASALCWFPDYDTFRALDPCAKTVYDFMTRQQQVVGSNQDQNQNQNQIMYVGLVGSNDNYNKFIAQNVCSPHRLSDLLVYSVDMNHPNEIYNYSPKVRSYEDLFSWGLSRVQILLKMPNPDDDVPLDCIYKSLIDDLPKQKCLLLIENIPYYEQLKAYANVLDFLSSGSIIFFTTTNESFFAKHDNHSWQMESLICDGLPTLDGLPSLSLCKGQMLEVTELKWLKKVLNGVSLRQQQCQSDMKTETPSDERQESPSHEESWGTNDDVEGGAAPLKKLKA